MSISENDIVDQLFPYVRPVLGAKNKETPEFVGSGILLKDHESLYLVTAAHVMDRFDGEEYRLFLDGVGCLVAILGEEHCSYTEDPFNRSDDRQDISIVKLSNEMQTRLDPSHFITSEKIDILGDHDPQWGYFCVGIPAKKGDETIDENRREILPSPYGLCAKESDIETYCKLQVTKSTHLALNFNVKKAYSKDNVRRTAPALNGLSGAPIWGFIKKSDTEIQPVIVAILTEYHQKDIKAILCTRIGEVFRGISL
jgi:hypothetical protein